MTQDRRITDKLPGQPLQWEEPAPGGLADDFRTRFAGVFTPSAAPAAGQAELAKLERWMPHASIVNAMQLSERGNYVRYIEVQKLLAAPVAADTEQATERSRFGSPELQARILANLTATPADAGAGLTDERIKELANANRGPNGILIKDINFARAIEREVLARMSTPGAPVTAYLAAELEPATPVYKVADIGQAPAPVTAEPVGSELFTVLKQVEQELNECSFYLHRVREGNSDVWRYMGKGEQVATAVRDAVKRYAGLTTHSAPARQAESLQSRDAIRDQAQQWISVDERLPEPGQGVIAFRPMAEATNDPRLTLTYYRGGKRTSPQGVEHGFECWCHPTHWMPLPTHPSASPTATGEKKGGAA